MNESEFNRIALRQKQSLPLEGKVILAQQRIREWYEHWDGNVYVSFSGGKDSTVLLHLVREVYPDVPAVFVDTGLEYPEIRKFAMQQPNVTVLRPAMRFDQVISKYGYPVVSKEQSAFISEYKTTKSEKLRSIRLNGNKYGEHTDGYCYNGYCRDEHAVFCLYFFYVFRCLWLCRLALLLCN